MSERAIFTFCFMSTCGVPRTPDRVWENNHELTVQLALGELLNAEVNDPLVRALSRSDVPITWADVPVER